MAPHTAALILVVVVVAVAAIGNRLAGAIAALLAAVWFDFFLTRPYERFTITRSADVTTAVLLLAVGLAVSQLAARARRLQVITITDAGSTWPRSTTPPRSPCPPRRPMPSSTRYADSSPACSSYAHAGSSTELCWATRRVWSRTAL